jgi:hypothetical protein
LAQCFAILAQVELTIFEREDCESEIHRSQTVIMIVITRAKKVHLPDKTRFGG